MTATLETLTSIPTLHLPQLTDWLEAAAAQYGRSSRRVAAVCGALAVVIHRERTRRRVEVVGLPQPIPVSLPDIERLTAAERQALMTALKQAREAWRPVSPPVGDFFNDVLWALHMARR